MEKIKKINKSAEETRLMILGFFRQFTRGIEAAEKTPLPKSLFFKPRNLIVCGMGGSSLAPELLFGLTSLNIVIHRSYNLPPQADKESLIICISYSGNTEETISAFKEALKRKLPLIVITSGGKLARIAKEKGIPAVIVSPEIVGTPPRLTLSLQFATLTQILTRLDLLPKSFIGNLKKLSRLNPTIQENKANNLAKKIGDKIPLIYFPDRFKGLGTIWKNSFNENAKVPSFASPLPEMNHNEIVGFNQEKGKNFISLIIQDPEDSPQMLKRVKITRKILKSKKIETEIIKMEKGDQIKKVFSCALLGVWTSYWLAINNKTDPLKIETINKIKKELKS